jgi:hypothetical protein
MDRVYSILRITKIFIGVLICYCSIHQATAQNKITTEKKDRRYTVYGGVGPSYYFNNLAVGKDGVHAYGYSVVGRFMWEPEYFLSLGVETGYFRLYTADYATSTNSAHVSNAVVPIQLIISMKFLKNYYCNFSMGQSILINKVTTTAKGNFDATTVSLGDFGLTVGYRHTMSERIFLGTELKGYYASKLDDKNIALAFMCGYRF